MYYALIMLSTLTFSGCFALNDVYRRLQGSGLKISFQFSFIGSVAGFVALTIINGMKFEFTWFTFIMAMIATVNNFAFTYCSFKALDRINLSLYSLFSMLGGMAVPFLQGILFYDEPLTLAKGLCFVFIVGALALTVDKGKKDGGAIYYAMIFLLNGMSGVLSKIFIEADFAKTSEAGYTNLMSLCSVVVAGLVVVLMSAFHYGPPTKKVSLAGVAAGAASGILSKVANWILVIALAHVDASVQYPMVTGGVMIFSTLVSCFGQNKPSKKEILSIVVAFVGLLLLFAIKI